MTSMPCWVRTSSANGSCTTRPSRSHFEGPLVDGMAAALRAEDPGARPVPTCSPAGPMRSRFPVSGIRCFGFSPLRLPPELDFTAMFHGVDERVPVEGLRFGVRVLDRFLAGV